MMDTFRVLFPTLDFSRIRFHAGIPFGLPALGGMILPSLWSEIHVFVDRFEPDRRETQSVLAHELVHALQIQTLRTRGYLNTWILSYLFCWLTSGSSLGDGSNTYEAEAYGFERDLLRRSASGFPPPTMRVSRARADSCRARRIRAVPILGGMLAALWVPVAALIATAGWLSYTLVDFGVRGVSCARGAAGGPR